MRAWPEMWARTMKPAMRPPFGRLALIALAAIGLAACATSTPQYAIDDNAPARSDNGDRGRTNDPGQTAMRSSTDRNDNWGDAFTAPLEDLNLKREQIPPILENAISKPYDLTGLDHCEQIAAEVDRLDSLLGEDFDEPPPPPDQSTMAQKGGRMANSAAVGAVRGATRSIIPFRGLVRQMTGADAHDKELDKAIQAGKVRRAYLKGVGMNKNCAPPAAPSWFKPRVYVETYVQDDPAAAPPPARTKRTSRKHH